MICVPKNVHIIVALVLSAVAALPMEAQEQLPRISLGDARLKIVRQVRAEPVAGVYANTVTADLIIGVDGSVESVTVLKGQKAQHASAVAALKQHAFAPVVIDGKPARVVFRIALHVPDTVSNDDLAKTSAAANSLSVPASRDIVLLADCSRALTTRDGSPQAIQTCRDAVAAADQAGAAAMSRRSPRRFLGDVYMFAKQWAAAIAAYQSVLSITGPPEPDDLYAGEILTMIAVAQVNLGDVAAADRNAGSAVARVEASMATHPDHRKIHVDALRTIYSVSAQVKRLQGDAEAAAVLERKAAALGPGK